MSMKRRDILKFAMVAPLAVVPGVSGDSLDSEYLSPELYMKVSRAASLAWTARFEKYTAEFALDPRMHRDDVRIRLYWRRNYNGWSGFRVSKKDVESLAPRELMWHLVEKFKYACRTQQGGEIETDRWERLILEAAGEYRVEPRTYYSDGENEHRNYSKVVVFREDGATLSWSVSHLALNKMSDAEVKDRFERVLARSTAWNV